MVEGEVRRALTDRKEFAAEYRIVLPDSTQRWVVARGRVYAGSNGKPVRMMGATIDITDRKQAEIKLQESEDQILMASEAARIGHWKRDLVSNEVWMSDMWRTMFGFSRSEPLDFDKFLKRVLAEDREAIRRDVAKAMAGDGNYETDFRVVLPDGQIHWTTSRGRVEFDEKHQPVCLRGVTVDITDRKQAEEKFRLVVEASPAGLVLVDSEGRIALVNRETEKIFCYSHEELMGQAIEVLLPERFRGAHLAHRAGFHAAPGKRAMGLGRELFARRKDGTEFPVEIGLSAIQTTEGILVLTAIVDLTERKRAEAESLQQREELAHVARVSTMGELAASVAHELNQPLGAILANTEAAELFLQQDPPALGELRDILADIRHDDERAGEVIRRMRALLRKRELDRQPLELNSVVEDVLQVVSGDAALRKTAISADLAPLLPKILGDRVHLQQVLLNLILNGMDAMAEQPRERRRLSVRTRPGADGQVELVVTDLGHGIDPDKLPRLFEPFYTTKTNGMGMGLSIARRIIEAHRGRIWAENNASGGATFRIELPTVGERARVVSNQ